ncbi:toll/interleukin-1 receptor domain-containing protein [Vibrio campbellii]|uniref:toll/interleukin-1 receptor domain-containing protein n=1 Tax=Vibrio campbellii TaxID=680 RepID=UPI00168CBF6B|nr:toll/interleukin-1 receptor domain-containing protein [Vibrio campbellii]
MANQAIVKIYIDSTGWDEEIQFADDLKSLLIKSEIGRCLYVRTFSEIDKDDEDFNNEDETVAAINDADIVIPVISSSYFIFSNDETDSANRDVMNSADRFLFPVILEEAEWSGVDWIVKSKVMPSDATPLNSLSQNSQAQLVTSFVKEVVNAADRILSPIVKPAITSVPIQAKPKQTNSIFISHAHEDVDFAELLKLRLEKEGIDSWLDTERLKIGQDWREEIDLGITSSLAVIAVMTPEARKSEYVTYEWAFAWGKNVKVFPIMLKQTQLHPRLESLQYLNFTDHPNRPWDELTSSIKELMEP